MGPCAYAGNIILGFSVIGRMVEMEGLGFPLTSRVPHGTMYICRKQCIGQL